MALHCPCSGQSTAGTCNQQQSSEEANEAGGGRERRGKERQREDRQIEKDKDKAIKLVTNYISACQITAARVTVAVTAPNSKGNNNDLHAHFSLE